MTLLEFIKEIPFVTIFLVGFGIFELVQLILKKREPTKLNIIIDSGLVGSSIFLALAVFIAYLTENVIPTPADVVNSIVTFIFFSIFSHFRVCFLQTCKRKENRRKNTGNNLKRLSSGRAVSER